MGNRRKQATDDVETDMGGLLKTTTFGYGQVLPVCSHKY